MKKLFVRTYASLLILYGLANTFLLLAIFFFKDLFPPEFVRYLVWCDNAALVTGIALFKTPLNFVLGYGLLRFRTWARYGIFVGIATLPILIATERLWWGEYRLHAVAAASLIISVCITLVFFTRPSVRELFTGKLTHRLIRATSFLAAGVVLLAFVPVLCSLTVKKVIGKYTDAPVVHRVTYNAPLSPANGLVPIRLMDESLPIPAGSYLMHYDRIGLSRNPWRFSFKGPKGFIEYGNQSMYQGTFEELPFIDAHGFDLEKFFHTNQWNPLVVILRMIGRPQGSEYAVKEVDTRDAKGFVTLLDDKAKNGRRKIAATFALFEKGGNRCVSGMVIIQEEPGPKADIILSSLFSSIRFLEPEKPGGAANHFRQGNALLKEGNRLEGQVELANAYYLDPGRREYREAFEATLSRMFREIPHTLGELKTAPGSR